ncbi:hypothetical protein [Kribbella catacumbae]|uniref:hypothetical protein n=1 Tax=Kribbella catacumbae TaxID=460086 RepID=UPI00036C390A|nr:hypothetical protein [Kribbella catacumbae]
MTERQLIFEDHFDGPTLDPAVWSPHYLPQWSSRAATAAQYERKDSCLRLFIPPDRGLWCEDDHTPPMRVSGIRSLGLPLSSLADLRGSTAAANACVPGSVLAGDPARCGT